MKFISKAYYEHANQLAQRLLRAFAVALELPEDWFVGKTDKHVSALRSNNYPDQVLYKSVKIYYIPRSHLQHLFQAILDESYDIFLQKYRC